MTSGSSISSIVPQRIYGSAPLPGVLVVETDKVVLFHYTLTNDSGETLDSSRERDEPMPYLHGSGNIVPGLEQQMVGKTVGDTFVAVVAPADAYGERSSGPPQEVPRADFPPGANIEVGVSFSVQGDDGPFMVWVVAVDDNTISLDTNHPLAGQTLRFDVEITAIRDATPDELTHGHPHGPDGKGGHHH